MSLTLTPEAVLQLCTDIKTRLATEPDSELVTWLQAQLETLESMATSEPPEAPEVDTHLHGFETIDVFGFTVADVQAIVPGTTDEEADWILEKAVNDFDQTIGVNETVLWCHAEALGLTLAQKQTAQNQLMEDEA